MSGLQPSCSIIMAATQAAGLGFLIMRRWRGGKHPSPLARQTGQRLRPPPGTPKWVLPCSPGLRGSPRYPGCAWHRLNNHIVVVPRQRAGTLPRTGHLPKLTPRGKSVNAQPPPPPPSAAICPIRVHSRFPPFPRSRKPPRWRGTQCPAGRTTFTPFGASIFEEMLPSGFRSWRTWIGPSGVG